MSSEPATLDTMKRLYPNSRFTAIENGCKTVRKWLNAADAPVSDRADSIPVFTFDPLMTEVLDACQKHWVEMFFLPGTSWLDLDDDKLPYTSNAWKDYGWRRIPTKDKKLKPVVHLVSTVGGGFILMSFPERLSRPVSEVIANALKALSTTDEPLHAALMEKIVWVIDRGYMQLAKQQPGAERTTIIQILEGCGAKYLSTCKDTPAFPFEVDLISQKDDCIQSNKKRPVISAYGTRSAYVAVQRIGGTSWHGQDTLCKDRH
jgi:hypothetical protein